MVHKRTVLGLVFVFLGLTIAVLHWVANLYHLYFEWWWADILMHFLGGLFLGVGILWWIRFEVPLRMRARVPLLMAAFVFVLSVGGAWEVFERVFGAYNATHYVLDTALDLVVDGVGALAAYALFMAYGK